MLKTLNSIDEKWDGTYKGKLCADGVYYYIANYKEMGGDLQLFTKQMKGAVTLISTK